MSAPLTIHCPECESILVVDPDTGAILRHESASANRKVGSFEEAAHEVAKRKERAEGLFAATVEREKHKKEILEKTFQEALEKARKDPSAKPRGIFDDD
jgi:DNA-directed RNA polymerase subunit M/transcription elongation factor TFIIS